MSTGKKQGNPIWARLGFYTVLFAFSICLTLPMLTDEFGDSLGLTYWVLSAALLFFGRMVKRQELALALLGGMVFWPADVNYDSDYVFALIPQIGLLLLAWKDPARLEELWKSLGEGRYVLLAYFLWSTISALNSNSNAFWVNGREILLFAMAMTLWSIWRTRSHALLWIFGAAAAGIALVLIYILCLSPFDGKGATYPFYQNGNYFSGLVSLALPFVGWLAYSLRNKWRWLAGLVFLGMLVAVVTLQSRGAWLGLLGGVGLGTVVYVQRAGLRWALVGIGASSLALFFFWGKTKTSEGIPQNKWEQLLSISDTEENFSNRERLMRWETAWRMGLANPWVGVGPGNYIREFKYFLETNEEVERISYWEGWNGYGHSEYLTRFGEKGFPGVLAFIGFLAFLVYRGFDRIRQEESTRLWSAIMMTSLGTWMVHGLFNDLSLDHRVMLLVFVLAVALMEKTKLPQTTD